MREQAWSLNNPENELRCPECDARFLNDDALEAHRDSEHAQEAERTSSMARDPADESEVRPTEPAP